MQPQEMSIFGIDPALIRLQQDQQDQAQAERVAQMDPLAAAAVPGLKLANSLGRDVGGLLGVQDPVMAENAKLRKLQMEFVQQGGNPATADGLKQFAQILAQNGMADKAMAAVTKANQLAQTEAETGLATSKLEKYKLDNKREEDFRAALAALGPNPSQEDLLAVAAKFGSADKVLDTQQKSLDRAEQRASKEEIARQQIEQKKAEWAARIQMAQDSNATKVQIAEMMAAARRDIATLAHSMKQDGPVTPVTVIDPENPNQQIVIDGRTGRKLGVSGKLSDSERVNVKQTQQMKGINGMMDEAESLLNGKDPETGKDVDKPTASGIGSLYDKSAAFMGNTPAGSVTASKLKVIGGALVSKVPRMEGPQSDKDVALYREMAAQVGDDTVPIPKRMEALKTMRRLYAKYEKLNPSTSSNPTVDALLDKYK